MSKSSRPSLDEVRAVFRLLGDLRDLRGAPAPVWQRVMVEHLIPLIGARQGSCVRLARFGPDAVPVFRSATHAGWIHVSAAAYWEGMLRSGRTAADPLLIAATRLQGEAGAVLRPELMSDEAYYAHPIACEIRSLAGIDAHASGWCRLGPGGEAMVLRFQHDANQRPAGPRQRNVLRLFLQEFHTLWHGGKMPADDAPRPVPRLSPRERQVLELLLAGETVKETGARLKLSYRTVEGHVKALHRKFNVSSRGELLARCLKQC